jgi:ABC-type multidrug transport system permease subunit
VSRRGPVRGVRPLVAKDARILRRSPLMVALLVVYPLLVALLLGVALSGEPAKPTIALVDQVPAERSTIDLGSDVLDLRAYARELVAGSDVVTVDSPAEAERMVRDGDAAGAVIIPPDTIDRLRKVLSLSGSDDLPTVRVLTNDSDPVRARAIREMVSGRLADANAEIGSRLIDVSSQYLGILTTGGDLRLFGSSREIIGLQRAADILGRVAERLPSGQDRTDVLRVQQFAEMAVRNMEMAQPLLRSVADPIAVERSSVTGPAVPLDIYAAAVAAAVSLLLVAVFLGAGLVALEREDRTFGRLLRSAVSVRTLLAAKTLLSGGLATLVALVVCAGLAVFLGLDAARIPLWLLATLAGGIACGALGVALGALAPEVRAASLLAILVLVPVIVLGLVPDDATSSAVGTVIDGVSALVPFRAALDLVTSALAHGPVAGPLIHLVVLAAAWSLVGWWGVRRTARRAS